MDNYYLRGEDAFLHAYGRYDVILEKGEGCYLYDTNGKKYLDFYLFLKNSFIIQSGWKNNFYMKKLFILSFILSLICTNYAKAKLFYFTC